MRALIVKDPWATLIVKGEKKAELRSRPTNIRGIIGIIKAGTKTVIGEVEIVNCEMDYSYGEFAWGLRNPRKYKKPVPYKHPRGAQIWVKI